MKTKLQKAIERIEGKKYEYNHNHDIQIGFRKDDKYSCGNCKQILDEIYAKPHPKKKLKCPHFRSFNQALTQAIEILKELEEEK